MRELEERISPRDRIFVAAYISNGYNATRAYKAAHPRVLDTTAGAEGHKTLKKPEIKSAIKAEVDHAISIMREAARKKIADIVEVRAFYEISDILDESGNLVAPFADMKEQGLTVCIDHIAKSVGKLGEEHVEYHLADRAKSIDQLRSILSIGNDDSGDPTGVTRVIVLPSTMSIDDWNEKFGPKEAKPL